MPSKNINVSIDNQILKLSNLDKVIFPQSGIIKAELIQYYQKIATYILPHISNRPLTLIRFPDGIDKIKFYAKNKADFTPNWLSSVKLPQIQDLTKQDKQEEEIEYLMANNTASLVYLANLAAIELHSMTLRAGTFMPDVFIFDLDPPAGLSFDELKTTAWQLKLFLENLGYRPFLKTSGSKGLHIYVPINPIYSTQEVVETVKNIAKDFILTQSNTTLLVSKERRTNKILIDIYRNHRSQTCVNAFSVRGIEGAPVSSPIFWEDFDNLKSSQQYNIHNIFDYLQKKGDPWVKIYESKTDLHLPNQGGKQLENYSQKRNFEITNEPIPEIIPNRTGVLKYVIQKHQATNLHYDLRLESDGLLLSWAIPKALPTTLGEKRMAIQTEPHPMKYIDFEGIIPANEYGGGEMWIFDAGTLTYLKKEAHKIKFQLSGGKITGEFNIYHTDGNKWLIEKAENGLLMDSISIQPMLAGLALKIPQESNYFFEIKWDGIRAMIKKSNDKIDIISRNGNTITENFPEIVQALAEMDIQNGLMDGEIVCLDSKGIPDFAKIISRMHLKGNEAVNLAAQHNKATLYLFDLLYLDGIDIRQFPIEKRRKWLRISFKDIEALRFSESFENGQLLFDAIKAQNMEGIIAKKFGSSYQSNMRNDSWQKIKVRNTEEALIIGYTRGQGDRALLFGALILAQKEGDKLIYKGKVGTGFSEQKLKDILAVLAKIPKSKKIITESIDEEVNAVWLEPMLWCEVQIASLTINNTFREPVFVKLREDLSGFLDDIE